MLEKMKHYNYNIHTTTYNTVDFYEIVEGSDSNAVIKKYNF